MIIKRHNKWCAYCKGTNDLYKIDITPFGVQKYICRECNTKKCKRFRQTDNGRKSIYKAVYKSINKYPQKQHARYILNYAVAIGKIKKPKICSFCKEHKKVNGHHTDYSKPLEVRWLCTSCHRLADKNLI